MSADYGSKYTKGLFKSLISGLSSIYCYDADTQYQESVKLTVYSDEATTSAFFPVFM